MKIIISPAKKMNIDTDTLAYRSMPVFLSEAKALLEWLRSLSYSEAKELWKCNEKIAQHNYRRVQEMELERNLTPAVIAYEGIQYQYMAPAVFDGGQMEYIQEHLRILSGFYGVLRPFDGVAPYRLEMQAKGPGPGGLYEFWGDKLYRELVREERSGPGADAGGGAQAGCCGKKGGFILNLASKEYSKCVEKYLAPEDKCLSVVFGELAEGKVKQKGTLAKMARGEMVRYLAENRVETPEKLKGFDCLGYSFEEALSTENEYVFLKK